MSLLLVAIWLLVAPACSSVEEGTATFDVATDSLYPGPQLEFLAATSEYVAFVDPDDIEFVETTEERTGYEVRVYRLGPDAEAPVPLHDSAGSAPPREFIRDPEMDQPIKEMHRQAATLMVFFTSNAGPGREGYFGDVVGLDDNGSLVPLDWEEVGDLLTAEFEALRAVAEVRSLTLPEALVAYTAEARARWEEPPQATSADSDGAALWVAVEGAADQDPPGVVDAWEAIPRNERQLRHNVAPNAVMQGREDVFVRVTFAVGTTDGRQGQALMLADADGILYAWDIATGTHTGGLAVRPGDPLEVLYAPDSAQPLAARKIGELPGIDAGLYGFEVVVDATAPEPTVTIGRTFADEGELGSVELGLPDP